MMGKKGHILDGSNIWKRIWKYLMITLGCAVYSAGIQFFMYPNAIVSGGVTGVAMIINQLAGLPVGVMTIVLNIPLFVLAWRYFGLEFIISSLVGMALSSAFIDLFALTGVVLTNDVMLACVIGGVIKGAGIGLVYYVGATTGGIDIVAKFLRQKSPHVNFGTIILGLDVVIVLAYALILNKYESAMYSIIAMFVVSKVIDLVLYGLDNSCVCYIISEKSQEIIKEITLGQMHRGVTILKATGAYTGADKQVILSVIKRQQIAVIRRIIKSIDQNAFFVVVDAKNVFGHGFDSIAEVR